MGKKVKQEIEKVSPFEKLHGTGRIVSRLMVAIPAVRQVETLWWVQSFECLFSRCFPVVMLLRLPLNNITSAAHPRQDRQQNRRLRRCRGRSHRCRQRSRTHARSAYSGKEYKYKYLGKEYKYNYSCRDYEYKYSGEEYNYSGKECRCKYSGKEYKYTGK